MIRHDHEVVQLERMFRDKRTQYIDQEFGIPLRLQQAPAHARLRRREKGASRVENVLR